MTDTQSNATPDTPAKRSLLSRAVSLVTRPVTFVARTAYTGLDNAIYNAPRLRPCLRDGLYVPTLLALGIAVFNVLVLIGTLGTFPGVFLVVNAVSLVLSLGVLMPTRLNTQTHSDSDWLLLQLFSARPSREQAPMPKVVAKASKTASASKKPAAKKSTAKSSTSSKSSDKATTKKPATKSTAKKATPSATKKTSAKTAKKTRTNRASETTETKTATKNRPNPRSSAKRSK